MGQYEIVPHSSLINLRLLADAQLGNASTIALDVHASQVVQQAAALTDHLVQTHTAVIVVGVLLQVLGELVDALSPDGNLNLGRTGVAGMGRVLFDNCSLFFF